MKVYRVGPLGFGKCGFDNLDEAIEEIKNLLSEAPPKERITIEILEMTEEEYENLPEFEGY
jgi:hypothetical protein